MIIQSLLMIAGKGNIVVLAEGVDFQIQKSKLIQYGCTIMRGQLFLPAESGEELAASIKEIKNISLV
jgi:EAL domain-containing protein (putative c-di-GMP-specific phosphodiesterase class I)